MRELLIGCGNQRRKILKSPDHPEWENLVTCDIDPNCGADHEIDLNRCNLTETFGAETFDEVHGYHILEHCGAQGDYRFFFRQWMDIYNLLKPGGLFFGIIPALPSEWVWSDPGHTRVIARSSFVFLDQAEYEFQIGKTALADYRWLWPGDFVRVWERLDRQEDQYQFVLQAMKPAKDGMAERLEQKAQQNRKRIP
jgi:hypothetical protein